VSWLAIVVVKVAVHSEAKKKKVAISAGLGTSQGIIITQYLGNRVISLEKPNQTKNGGDRTRVEKKSKGGRYGGKREPRNAGEKERDPTLY